MKMNPKDRWDTCYYMSSTSKIDEKYLDCFGFFITNSTGGNESPRSGFPTRHLRAGRPWSLDNSVFTNKFKTRLWIGRLRALMAYRDTCLFVVVPDVVGDFRATLAKFPRYAKIVRKFGYPVALATQDGLTPELTPWNDFDCLFVGGTDGHKLGREAGALIDEAIKRNKWVHIGRVNSPKRMRQFWRADSWDGTHIGYEPDRAAPKMAYAVREIRAKKIQQLKLWEDL